VHFAGSAWTKPEAEAGKLQTTSAESCESTKASFEHASHELARAWHKINPEGK